MNEKIRKAFPVTEKYTYLNSAAVGTIPAVSVEAVYSQLKRRFGKRNGQFRRLDSDEKPRP